MNDEIDETDGHLSTGAFIAALRREDDLGMVVRAHIHVEAILLELIALRLRRPETLSPRLGCAQRVSLALGVVRENEDPRCGRLRLS